MAGFIIRVSDKVALSFDREADFIGPLLLAGSNFNLFNDAGRWIGYFVPNGREGFNQFELSGLWRGYVVGSIISK